MLQIGKLCFITNWGKCCEKLEQLLQIRATIIKNRVAITNWIKIYYKFGHVLQSRAIITNWGIKIRSNFSTCFLGNILTTSCYG